MAKAISQIPKAKSQTPKSKGPAYKVRVQVDEEFAGEVNPNLLRAAARAALKHQNAPKPNDLNIALTGDEYLRALNKKFRKVDKPTDVLSFPAEAPSLVAKDGGFVVEPYLGDIAISYPRALAQAAEAGHPVEAELQLLVVHGVLHLMGYDHANAEEKARMWAAQAVILSQLGAAIAGPSED